MRLIIKAILYKLSTKNIAEYSEVVRTYREKNRGEMFPHKRKACQRNMEQSQVFIRKRTFSGIGQHQYTDGGSLLIFNIMSRC